MRLITTVIGSLPRLHEDLETSIRLAVDLQVNTGIDIISDGEQRTDMLSYISDSMCGVKIMDEKIHVVDKIRPVGDMGKSSKVVDFLEARKHLMERGYSNGLKVGVVGPITFGFSAALRGAGPYGSIRNMELYEDVAYVVNKIAKLIQSYDGMVQIDEPGISAGFLDPKMTCGPLDAATEGLERGLTSIHACGKLSIEAIRSLGRTKNVSILSLEFAGSPSNIDLLSQNVIEEISKKIGVGCMRTNVLSQGDLTSVEMAVETIRSVISKIGINNVAYIHPDCGLRRTKPDLAFLILKNLVNASKAFKI